MQNLLHHSAEIQLCGEKIGNQGILPEFLISALKLFYLLKKVVVLRHALQLVIFIPEGINLRPQFRKAVHPGFLSLIRLIFLCLSDCCNQISHCTIQFSHIASHPSPDFYTSMMMGRIIGLLFVFSIRSRKGHPWSWS